jgi:hypothetical protein
MMDVEDSGQLPQAFAALSDVRGVMGEAAEHLADLVTASHELGAALIRAGLPQSAWGARQASLRLLSDSVPELSVGAWLTRVERFARHDGLAWLHGTARDHSALREEVTHLSAIARPLCEAVQRLHRPTIGNRSVRPIQRVFGHPSVLPPLQNLTELLRDLEALAPFLRPLTERDRPAPPYGQRTASDAEASPPSGAGAPSRSEPGASVAFAPTTRLGGSRIPAALRGFLTVLRGRFSSQLRQPHPHRRWWITGALGVFLLAVAALVLTHQPSTTPRESGATSGGARSATTHPTRTATARVQTTATPSSQATGAPALRLALTCVVHGTTATLTIRDAGPSALSWQAKPPPSLRVTPAQGTLDAGQTATAQVSAVHKKTATGTVLVTATQGTASTSSSVDCQ